MGCVRLLRQRRKPQRGAVDARHHLQDEQLDAIETRETDAAPSSTIINNLAKYLRDLRDEARADADDAE